MSEHQGQHSGNGAVSAHKVAATISGEEPKLSAPLTSDREFKFTFKKQKVKDELGQEVKRPPVIVNVPIPTFDGILAAMIEDEKDKKVQQFVLDLVEEAIKDQVRAQLSDDDKPVNRQEDLDLNKLTLKYIANIPKSERTGGGISKETWSDFEKDYIAVMTPIREQASSPEDKDSAAARVQKAAGILVNRLTKSRTDKPVLRFLREQLAVWSSNTENLEEFAEVFKFLDDKATMYINADNVSQLEAL